MSLNALNATSHAANAFVSAAVDFAEQVIVTPCVRRVNVGIVATEDSAFASHCTFSLRRDRVKRVVEGRPISYETIKQTALFPDQQGLAYELRPGDRITRPWDGKTFEIASVCRERTGIVCDIVAIATRLH